MSLKVPQTATEMVQSWSPRPLNRGEHFELDHYEIYFSFKKTMVQLHLKVKDNKIIIRKFNGNSDFVYSEVLKGLPDNKLEEFKEAWINAKLDWVMEGDGVKYSKTILGKAIQESEREDFKQFISDKIQHAKKNKKADLVVGNKRVEIKVDKTKKEIIDLGFFNYQNPNQILADKIRSSTKDISEIAEKVGLHISMVSKQMKGQREITRDHAFAYARFFGCDPADILFAAPQIPIWSTVDFLNFKEHNMPFNPGECVTVTEKREYVVCPRDIYRPDIKAVKVNSPGSYLDGMVLFYYASSDVKQDCLGRLSIVGDQDDTDDELMKELRFGEKQRYYIGILEQYKGKTKLLNPDPYAKESLPKEQGDIIINNITPSFASPIVGIVNPNQIKKDKHSSKLFKHNDEILKTTRMTEQKMVEQMKIKELTLQKQAHELEHKLKKEIEEQIKKHEQLLVQMEKKLKEQDKKNLYSGIGSLFYPPNTTQGGGGGLLEVRGTGKGTTKQGLAAQKRVFRK